MLTTNLTEEELKSQLVAEIEKLDKGKLLQVYQFIAQSFGKELIDMVAEFERNQEVNPKSIDFIIKEHRKRYPYR